MMMVSPPRKPLRCRPPNGTISLARPISSVAGLSSRPTSGVTQAAGQCAISANTPSRQRACSANAAGVVTVAVSPIRICGGFRLRDVAAQMRAQENPVATPHMGDIVADSDHARDRIGAGHERHRRQAVGHRTRQHLASVGQHHAGFDPDHDAIGRRAFGVSTSSNRRSLCACSRQALWDVRSLSVISPCDRRPGQMSSRIISQRVASATCDVESAPSVRLRRIVALDLRGQFDHHAPARRSTVGTTALVNGSSMVAPCGGAISMMSPAPKLWIAMTRPSGSSAALTAASPIRSAW